MTEKPLSFSQAAHEIRDADLLLFRGHAAVSEVIRVAGRSLHSHAGKAAWVRDILGRPRILYCIDTIEGVGGRALPLETLVRSYPGSIDVFRTNPERIAGYDRTGSVLWSWQNLPGTPYGKRGIGRIARQHLPILRWFFPPSHDDDLPPDADLFCSEAVSAADRLGGHHDPVPNLSDRDTEPGDLERSEFYAYLFTLTE
jgi:hypothetical protein